MKRCSIILKDDFNNVLVVQRKVKRGEPKVWSLVSKNMKSREDEEKCINRAVKEELKSIVFDLDLYLENENNIVYEGTLKERIETHKDIVSSKWVKINDLNSMEFIEEDKVILRKYFTN